MQIVEEPKCPRCGSIELLEGPSAGQTINAKCKKCDCRFNVVVLGALAGLGTIAPVVGFMIEEV